MSEWVRVEEREREERRREPSPVLEVGRFYFIHIYISIGVRGHRESPQQTQRPMEPCPVMEVGRLFFLYGVREDNERASVYVAASVEGKVWVPLRQRVVNQLPSLYLHIEKINTHYTHARNQMCVVCVCVAIENGKVGGILGRLACL